MVTAWQQEPTCAEHCRQQLHSAAHDSRAPGTPHACRPCTPAARPPTWDAPRLPCLPPVPRRPPCPVHNMNKISNPPNWVRKSAALCALHVQVNGKNFSVPDDNPIILPLGKVVEWNFNALPTHPM